jgi:hypothetical protein
MFSLTGPFAGARFDHENDMAMGQRREHEFLNLVVELERLRQAVLRGFPLFFCLARAVGKATYS